MAARKKAATRNKTGGVKKKTGKRTTAARKASQASSGKRASRKGGSRKPASKTPAVGNATAYPEVEGLVELMDRHGLVEIDYKAGPGGMREIRLSRAAPLAGAVVPAALGTPPEVAAESPAAEDEGLVPFTSPMVGTFYRAPSPEASPFASVGDSVDGTSTVCIIEAMKVMNEITPDVSGEIVSIEVENGEAVEFGQTLFLLRSR